MFPSFKKYKKDYFTVAAVLLIGIIAVMGQHFSDIAQTKFWWTFWDAATVICIVAWIAGWIYLKSKDKYSR
jgi:hypothetical protein